MLGECSEFLEIVGRIDDASTQSTSLCLEFTASNECRHALVGILAKNDSQQHILPFMFNIVQVNLSNLMKDMMFWQDSVDPHV